jgi:hypothetical protein
MTAFLIPALSHKRRVNKDWRAEEVDELKNLNLSTEGYDKSAYTLDLMDVNC